MTNKEKGVFQAGVRSQYLVFRTQAVMCAVSPPRHTVCDAFPSQHSLNFHNKVQDPKRKRRKMQPDDRDQISLLCDRIIRACQKHRHPLLGWTW